MAGNRGHNPGPHKYTTRELEIFASVQKSHFRARATTSIGRYFFIAVIFWGIAWGTVHSLEELRGTITIADLKATLSLSREEGGEAVKLVRAVFEGLSVFANAALWFLYRNARKRQDNTILQLGPFREMYEKIQDPGRTTSGLQPDGQTPPEEKS